MRIYETHAHLDFSDYENERASILKACFKAGVEKIINVGIDLKSTENGISLSMKYPQIKVAGGFHPCEASSYDEERLKELLKHKNIVAVGEIGLDYYRLYHPVSIQKKVFEAQIKLAKDFGLPLIIHDREAHEDCFNLLKKYSPNKVVFHCFSGDVHFADRVLNEGWYISITGVVTYKNSNLGDIVRITPREKLLIETDCPYLSPVPFRGKRNSPEYLVYIIQKIADILNIQPKIVAEQTFKNAEDFFSK